MHTYHTRAYLHAQFIGQVDTHITSQSVMKLLEFCD